MGKFDLGPNLEQIVLGIKKDMSTNFVKNDSETNNFTFNSNNFLVVTSRLPINEPSGLLFN